MLQASHRVSEKRVFINPVRNFYQNPLLSYQNISIYWERARGVFANRKKSIGIEDGVFAYANCTQFLCLTDLTSCLMQLSIELSQQSNLRGFEFQFCLH